MTRLARRGAGRGFSPLGGVLCFGLSFLLGLSGVVLANQGRLPWSRLPSGGGDVPPPGYGDDLDPPGHATGPFLWPGLVLRIPADDGGAKAPDPPLVVRGVAAGSGRVALTFDCGWIWEPAAALLDALDREGLKATFFPRGKWIEDHPELVQEFIRRGHEVGNHSYTHPHMLLLGAEEARREIELGKRALVAAAGTDAFLPFYRPPYGSHGRALDGALSSQGYGWVIMWQVDSLDWTEPGVDAIVENVLGGVSDGGIVLMHIGSYQTVQALPAIVRGLKAKGLKPVRVSELLGLGGAGQGGGAPAGGWRYYTVKPGDTLAALALEFGLSEEDLRAANPWLPR